MLSFSPGALVRYGFDDRVLALCASFGDAHPSQCGSGAQDLRPARIVRVERSSCVAVGPSGEERPLRSEALPAVGDWVLASDDEVHHVLPRWSAFTRVDPSGDRTQTLAANVDVIAVVTPADRSSPARVEREVALAWDSGAVPLVVVTKADLDPGVAVELAGRVSGVDVTAASAITGAGIEPLRARLRPDRTAVLLGPSGAGKSTLANALVGADALSVGSVRAGDGRGRHTTTSRQMLALPGGGVLIDTPGLRSLGLHADLDVGAGFPDVDALGVACRFADCRHEHEPGCAVLEAVASGALDAGRLRSFHKLTREVAWEQRRHQPLARQEERRRFKQRTAGARQKRRGRG